MPETEAVVTENLRVFAGTLALALPDQVTPRRPLVLRLRAHEFWGFGESLDEHLYSTRHAGS